MVKLQGTAPNQVPTNADLGSLAYVDHDNVNLTAADLRLKALSKTKSQTAADVFVYDTSKDSDGGAWRHRTQHTSWYNEGASNTRGSRKEFPAVAVIVAESNKVTIYDGDDPSLPMWMVFGSSSLWVSNLKAVSFRSGILLGGVTGSGLRKVDFLQDTVGRYFTTGFGVWSINVSGRGTPLNFTTTDATAAIVNANVNDVAMTVLPDAPTDLATGLPVPTIAVATDGGVSVIKDSGDVWDSAATGKFEALAITDGQLYARDTSFADDVVWYGGLSDISADGFVALQSHWTGTVFGMKLNSDIGTPLAAWGSYSLAVATSSGLNSVAQTDATSGDDRLNGMVAYTTSDYSDPNGNGVYDGEHVTNGDFATDISGWTDGSDAGGAISWNASGYMDLVYTSGIVRASQAISLIQGKVYVLEFEVVAAPSSSGFYIDGVNVANFVTLGTGTHAVYYTASATGNATLEARVFAAGTVSIDNITIRLADEDRSVNGKGLGVHGSITKAAVATGADVVAYSGFTNNTSYLEQPYNSDLDFGTGDFSVMGWGKSSGAASRTYVSYGTTTAKWQIQHDSSGLLRGYIGSDIASYAGINDGTWKHLAMVRSSGTMYLYVNGVEVDSLASATDATTADATLRFGLRHGDINTLDSGSLALWRVSATAPTADQIAKIYNDEKMLFQDSAKATLTGSSDAVTALAHDPDTNLLHVGTSGGRSVFQGLRRVDETATAVTTAISAVDGLVVEQ